MMIKKSSLSRRAPFFAQKVTSAKPSPRSGAWLGHRALRVRSSRIKAIAFWCSPDAAGWRSLSAGLTAVAHGQSHYTAINDLLLVGIEISPSKDKRR